MSNLELPTAHVTNVAEATNPLLPNGTFFAELIIFLLVLWFMWRVVVPPITKALNDRAERVARTARERQEATAKLAEAEQRYDSALAGARREAGNIRGEARVEGQRTLDQLRAQANDEVNAIRRRAEADLTAQRQRALRELQGDIGSLSASLASRVVGADVTADGGQQRTVAAFMDNLTARGERADG